MEILSSVDQKKDSKKIKKYQNMEATFTHNRFPLSVNVVLRKI